MVSLRGSVVGLDSAQAGPQTPGSDIKKVICQSFSVLRRGCGSVLGPCPRPGIPVPEAQGRASSTMRSLQCAEAAEKGLGEFGEGG